MRQFFSGKQILIALFLLAGTCLFIYFQTLRTPFVFDDGHAIQSNPAIRDWGNYGALWEVAPNRFLTFVTLAFNYRIARLSVVDYHITNILIHFLAALVVFFLTGYLVRACGKRTLALMWHKGVQGPARQGPDAIEFSPALFSSKAAFPVALFAALIFTAHPVQTQAVTYIIQRATSLAALFYLASMLFYAKAASMEAGMTDDAPALRLQRKIISRPRSTVWYYGWLGGALFCGICAMFSKEIAITLPFAIVLMEFFFFSSTRGDFVRRVPRLVPFLALAPIIPLTMLLTQKVELGELGRITAETEQIGRGVYLLTQIHVVRTYLRLLVAPFGQNLDYDYPLAQTLWAAPTLLSLLLLCLVFAVGIVLYRRHRLGSFGVFFFFLTILLESSIFPISDVIFEHRLYLPLFGFSLFVSTMLYSGVQRIWGWKPTANRNDASLLTAGRFQNGKQILRNENTAEGKGIGNSGTRPAPLPFGMSKNGLVVFCVMAGITLVFFAGMAYRRNLVWRSEETLWLDVIQKSPHKARGHNNLGAVYLEKKRYAEAIEEYRKAIALEPNHHNAHVNLSFALATLQRPEEAIAMADRALQIKPDSPAAYHALGKAYLAKGDLAEALRYYEKAVQAAPDYVEAHYDWGNALARQERFGEAIPHFEAVLAARPENLSVRANLAIALLEVGRLGEAIFQAEETVRRNPRFPLGHLALGKSLLRAGKSEQGREQLKQVLQSDPGNVEARLLLRQSSQDP